MASAGNVSTPGRARRRGGLHIHPLVRLLAGEEESTLRLGQATMLCALAGLYRALQHAGKLRHEE
jgi:hypothetical protein